MGFIDGNRFSFVLAEIGILCLVEKELVDDTRFEQDLK